MQINLFLQEAPFIKKMIAVQMDMPIEWEADNLFDTTLDIETSDGT